MKSLQFNWDEVGRLNKAARNDLRRMAITVMLDNLHSQFYNAQARQAVLKNH